MKKSNFVEADWEVLAYECEDCQHEEYDHSKSEVGNCIKCDSESIIPEWNYENLECMSCDGYIDIEDEIYVQLDGEFEDVICCECHDNLE